MPVEESMSVLRGFNAGEEAAAGAGREAEAAPAAPEAKGEGEEGKAGLQLKGYTPPAKKEGKAWRVPSSFALLLGFILLLVFAVSPAYQGAPYTRLQLLLSVVLRGGEMKPEAVSGVQPLSSMPGNGTDGTDYHVQGLISSGSLYSGGDVLYG